MVAPYVGAWIETLNFLDLDLSRASHPTWVRGLKLLLHLISCIDFLSHPTWVRGLKPIKLLILNT